MARVPEYDWANFMKGKFGGKIDDYAKEYHTLLDRTIEILERAGLPVGESLVNLGYLPSITPEAEV